jgi:hypothetical protein
MVLDPQIKETDNWDHIVPGGKYYFTRSESITPIFHALTICVAVDLLGTKLRWLRLRSQKNGFLELALASLLPTSTAQTSEFVASDFGISPLTLFRSGLSLNVARLATYKSELRRTEAVSGTLG